MSRTNAVLLIWSLTVLWSMWVVMEHSKREAERECQITHSAELCQGMP